MTNMIDTINRKNVKESATKKVTVRKIIKVYKSISRASFKVAASTYNKTAEMIFRKYESCHYY